MTWLFRGNVDRKIAGEICAWFCEEKQEFNRHEESSFVLWGVGRAQERERRCCRSNRHSHLNAEVRALNYIITAVLAIRAIRAIRS